jgi:Family of unknown function (DUF6280)
MFDSIDSTAYNFEQGQRARKLFAAVVLAALDDAIADDKKYGNGPDQIARWARSRDGREVLSCAGIDPGGQGLDGIRRQGRPHQRCPEPGRVRASAPAGSRTGRSRLIAAILA